MDSSARREERSRTRPASHESLITVLDMCLPYTWAGEDDKSMEQGVETLDGTQRGGALGVQAATIPPPGYPPPSPSLFRAEQARGSGREGGGGGERHEDRSGDFRQPGLSRDCTVQTVQQVSLHCVTAVSVSLSVSVSDGLTPHSLSVARGVKRGRSCGKGRETTTAFSPRGDRNQVLRHTHGHARYIPWDTIHYAFKAALKTHLYKLYHKK